MGLAFKENCPDLRNSRVIDVIDELKSYDADVSVHDPVCSAAEVRREYDIELVSWGQLKRADAIVLAVAHSEFVDRPIVEFVSKSMPAGCC